MFIESVLDVWFCSHTSSKSPTSDLHCLGDLTCPRGVFNKRSTNSLTCFFTATDPMSLNKDLISERWVSQSDSSMNLSKSFHRRRDFPYHLDSTQTTLIKALLGWLRPHSVLSWIQCVTNSQTCWAINLPHMTRNPVSCRFLKERMPVQAYCKSVEL